MPAHTQILRIHYQDTDATGIVYHGAYLDFAERGRVEALRSVGAPPAALADAHGLAFLVREARLRYLRPLRLDDEVTMRSGTIRIGGASCGIRQEFWRDGVLAVRSEIDLACVRLDGGRPARIPPRWCAALDELRDLPGES